MKYILAIAALLFSTPALAQPDRVITPAEIEPAVTVMNDWNKRMYPTFALRYSSDPNALQSNGYIALRGPDRLIALFISKYLASGAKSTQFVKGQSAPPAITARVFDELREASYRESGTWENISLGHLNTTPGAVLVGLVASGAQLPTGNGDCSAQVNAALDRVDAAIKSARP